MARKLRVQYPGALYHVINRGNYQYDVFASVGAAKAFEATLDATCVRHGWLVHAYVIMRNHFHLALETPRPNLVEGMHWLQSTFGTRFNRYRSKHGHLFQGRYQALLIEEASALTRVTSYIHLNPVRTKIVPPTRRRVFPMEQPAPFHETSETIMVGVIRIFSAAQFRRHRGGMVRLHALSHRARRQSHRARAAALQ